MGRLTSVMNDIPAKCVSIDNNYDVWTDYVRTVVSENLIILCVLKWQEDVTCSRLWSTSEPNKRKFHRGNGSFSVASFVCCLVEVCATSRSLVQRSPTDCGASLCVI